MAEQAIAPTASGGAALWEAVRAELRVQREVPAIVPADRRQPLPAGFSQEGMWLSEQLAGSSAQHNLCVAMLLKGRLYPAALGRSLEALLERHEILRTRLEWTDGRLCQFVHPPEPFRLSVESLLGGLAALEYVAAEEARRIFDLAAPPLLRVRLLRLDAETHGLVLTFHHLAFDGWSFEVFMGELGQLYGAFRDDRDFPLPPPALQYADFAVWQRSVLQGDRLRELTEFWSAGMADAPCPLRLPADSPRSILPVRRGGCLSFAWPDELSRGIRKLAAAEGVTPFILLLAAYQVLLARHSGEEDVTVGSPVALRNRPELRGLVGPLVNILVFRCRPGGDLPFRDFLARVRETVLGAYAHQELPFERVVTTSPHWRGIHADFPVRAMLTYLNLPRSGWALPGLEVDAWNVANGTARFDLNLTVRETERGLCGQFEYDAERFDTRYIQSLVRQWETLLGGIVSHPEFPVGELPLLSRTEIEAILALTTGPQPDYPREIPIHRVFESVAGTQPDATALIFGGECMTYRELDRRAQRLARILREQSINPGDFVGLCLPPSPDYVIGVLAVLKAGAAYVALNLIEPVQRVQAAIGDRLAIVLTRQAQLPSLIGFKAPLLALDALERPLRAESAERDDLAPPVQADQPAYLMMTSGSTGAPKAVCIPHRGVVRLARSANYAELDANQTTLLLAPLAFDASTFELWGALLNGATLVIPTEPKPSLSQIAGLIHSHGISTLWLTTGLFEAMLAAEPAALAQPRQVLVGGEVLPPAAARRFLRIPGAGRLINCYGPTECTTFTTFHPVSEGSDSGTVPIGSPLAHAAVYLLDSRRRPVLQGVVGDAWIAGDGLMLGYLDDASANAACLLPDPFVGQPGRLMYRSGDRMRLRFDGTLEFVGRADRQVKIRGFRIEPCEIEAVLSAHPRVMQAAVATEDAGPGKQLLAYVAANSIDADGSDLAAELRDWLRERLPEPFRPAAIRIVPKLPLKSNGKLDYDALPRPPLAERHPEIPRDLLEWRLAEAFAQALGRADFGRDEDFFAAGGHSLLALHLVARLESDMDLRLPLVALFQHPTPERLASYIRMRQPSAQELVAGVAEVRRGAKPPPLFMVPGGHGGMRELTLYARLMRHAGRDMAVYGLLVPRPLPASVEELASLYLARVRHMQPRGPYALAGECVGGVIAYEMARQLNEAGEEVALLLLLDTWCPTDLRERYYYWVDWPLHVVRVVWMPLLNELRAKLFGWGRRPGNQNQSPQVGKLRKLSRWLRPWLHRFRPGQGSVEEIATYRTGRRYIRLVMRYRPRNCQVPLHLLVSDENHRLGLERDWQPLAGAGLRLWSAPGIHESYIKETPETTAPVLDACLASVFDE